MQIIRGAVFVEVELAVDMIHVMHHQAHGLVAVARSDGVDQLVVFVVGAMRAVAAFVLGDDQRGLGDQAALETHQGGVLGHLGQFQVELTRQANASAPVAAGKAGLFVDHHLPQFGELFVAGVLHRQLGDRPLHQAPCEEYLPSLLDARAGHHRATVGP